MQDITETIGAGAEMVIIQEEHMTNFEKWKQELTIEGLKVGGGAAVGIVCEKCPAVTECEEGNGAENCYQSFRNWGRKEAPRLNNSSRKTQSDC